MVLLLTCGRDDTIYTPPGQAPVTCAAFVGPCSLRDSASTVDTSALCVRDTFHTGADILFAGRINPAGANLARAGWSFGDGAEAAEPAVCHAYASAGVHRAVFSITDAADISLYDTVVVTVNTPPDAPRLLAPDSALADVNPQDDRLFSWRGSDADGDSLLYVLYLDTTPSPARIAAAQTDTTYRLQAGALVKLRTYYWRVTAVDPFGDSTSSGVFLFSTRDPVPSTVGSIAGSIYREGLSTHQGIHVVVLRNSSILGSTSTDSSGAFRIDGLAGGVAQVAIDDGSLFDPETLTVTIVNGTTTVVPSTTLSDASAPGVTIILGTASDTVRVGTTVLVHIAASDTLYRVDSIRADYGSGMHRITMDTVMTLSSAGDYPILAEAYDEHGNRGYTARTIHVNTPPPPPQLTAPVGWAELSTGQVLFTWTCTDPDAAANSLIYTICLDTLGDFSSAARHGGLTEASYTWTASAQDVGTHYWKVMVFDGLDSAWSGVDSFRVSVGTGRITGVAVRQDLAAPRNGGIEVEAVKGGVVQRTTSTDSTGAYIFNDLSGSVTVRASDNGFAPESVTVSVVNGITTGASTLTLRDTLAPLIGRSADATVRAGALVSVTASASDTFYAVDSFGVDYGSGMRQVDSVDTGVTFAAPGDHYIILAAADVHGNTRRDSIRIHVNYPPAQPVHATLASNARVEPGSSPVFTWGCFDADNQADVRYDIYIGTSPSPAPSDRVAQNLGVTQYTWPDAGSQIRTCYWRVAAFDGYDTSWSDVDSFRVAPALVKVYGYAMLEGVRRHNGIRLTVAAVVGSDVYQVYIDDAGYGYTTLPPASYTVTAEDTLRGVFTQASKTITVSYADSVSWDTLVLHDENIPVIACTTPSAGATLTAIAGRNLTIAGTLADVGSGILPDSVRITINGSPVSGATVTTGTWQYVYASIPDGRYDLVVNAKDSAGNPAATLSRTFWVNCKTIAARAGFFHDTMLCTASVANVSPAIRAYYWDFDKHGSAGWNDSTLTSAASTVKPWPLPHPAPAGWDTLVVMAVDQSGMAVYDTVPYNIVQDRPVARAGTDTGVAMGSTITVRGSYDQRFGHVVKWEWGMNATSSSVTWTTTSGPTNSVTAPSMYDPEFVCLLRVTDDLGVMDTDTVVVTVGIAWEAVGVRGMSPGAVGSFSLGADTTGNIIVAFCDSSNGGKIRVMSYAGSAWADFGNVGFSTGRVDYVQLSTGEGWGGGGGGMVRYDVYRLGFSDRIGSYDSLRVYGYSGGLWSTRGTQGLINGNIDYKLNVVGETPYVCMSDRNNSGRVVVKYIDYNSGDWVQQGSTLSTKTYAGVDGFVGSSTVMYDAITTRDTIKTWSGTAWNFLTSVSLPSSAVLMAQYYSDVYTLDNYYVVGRDRLAMKKFSGGTWSFVDSTGLDTTYSYGNGLFNGSGNFFVAFHQGDQWEYVTVKALVNDRWRAVGPECFTTGPWQTGPINVIVCKGVPYIAFKDVLNGGRLTVMRLR